MHVQQRDRAARDDKTHNDDRCNSLVHGYSPEATGGGSDVSLAFLILAELRGPPDMRRRTCTACQVSVAGAAGI
jgi:hypothetical protein